MAKKKETSETLDHYPNINEGDEQLTDEDVKNLSIGEMYQKIKLPKKTMRSISIIGDESFEKMIKKKYSLSHEKEEQEKQKKAWKEIYLGLKDILKTYLDLNEKYYCLLALWIIGTYFHKQFYTYPYLFINAMKGSGKTRLLKLIKLLSKDGQMLNSLTEAVLFRTKGTLCIDEFEGISRKGAENLRELLNSAYKKGTTVKRMKKKRTQKGEEQVVEEFEVFRPIAIANIWGMEVVLGDRCIPLILEKSSKCEVIKLIEDFDQNRNVTQILGFMRECEVCDVTLPLEVYTQWNNYINYKHHTTHTNNFTNFTIFDKIYQADFDGRHLELALPLLVIASFLGEDILDEVLDILKEIVKIKKEDEFTENTDVSVIDFISQLTSKEFTSVKQLTNDFAKFLDSHEDWINPKWMGRALKRLNLIKEKKHRRTGSFVKLDIEKAQEKIKIFK